MSTKKKKVIRQPKDTYEAVTDIPDFDHLDHDTLFIDDRYQREAGTRGERIANDFKPYLFQTLIINVRETPNRRGLENAVIDGQARWVAADLLNKRGAGIRMLTKRVPCLIFSALTPKQE